MPNIANEQNRTLAQYPGVDNNENVTYSEKHHFGYRWYDEFKVKPAFPFGHGLTYTKFEYFGIKVDRKNRKLWFGIKNVGKRWGAEIAQAYLVVP